MKMDDQEPPAAEARSLTVTLGVCDPQICPALVSTLQCGSHVACIVM